MRLPTRPNRSPLWCVWPRGETEAQTTFIASWLHTREPKKKDSTQVKRWRKKTDAHKEAEVELGDYLVGTDENMLVLNRTYANRSNAERAAKTQ